MTPTCLPADAVEVADKVRDNFDPASTEWVKAELVAEPTVCARRAWPVRLWRGFASACDWTFGVVSLVIGLSILAALPGFQFLSLGYLLEASGRVTRTGRLRAGLFGVRKASRLSSILLGAWLSILPFAIVASTWRAAWLIEPEGVIARRWWIASSIVAILTALHIIGACWRGGRLRHFLWPFVRPRRIIARLRQGGLYRSARDGAWNYVAALRLPYYFWLGLRGFVGGLVWIAPPVTLMAMSQRVPALGWLGAALLVFVSLYLPFLQARFAAERRFAAFFELRTVRRCFTRAPVAFLLALWSTLLFALPLYLLKIEMVPREAIWLPSLVFLAFIFPARLLCGWACSRAERRALPRWWGFRWTSRLLMLPAVLIYVIVVFFSQYTAWHGVWSLYEQHAFLLPVPFFGL